MDTTPTPEKSIAEALDRLRTSDPADTPELAEEVAAVLAAELEQPEPSGESS